MASVQIIPAANHQPRASEAKSPSSEAGAPASGFEALLATGMQHQQSQPGEGPGREPAAEIEADAESADADPAPTQNAFFAGLAIPWPAQGEQSSADGPDATPELPAPARAPRRSSTGNGRANGDLRPSVDVAQTARGHPAGQPAPAVPAQPALPPEVRAAQGESDSTHPSIDRLAGPTLSHASGTEVSHALRANATQTATPGPYEIRQMLHAGGWGQALSQQVVLIATRKEQTAEIRINPPHLGPVEVTLTLSGEDRKQAMVHFAAQNAAVREVIEAALPRLKEALGDAGIALGNASVGAETSGRDNGAQSRDGTNRQKGADQTPQLPAETPGRFPKGTAAGLVDTFA